MRIKYFNDKVKRQCTVMKDASKLFGGDKSLVRSLFARITVIEQADVLKDIIMMPTFHFHNLQGKLDGYFAIDVKSRKDKWRIILQPLNENEEIFDPCHIDEIAVSVRIVEIREVSAHYE